MNGYNMMQRYLTLAAFAALVLPGSAGAATLYDNLAFGSSSSSAVSSTNWAANSFSPRITAACIRLAMWFLPSKGLRPPAR